MCVYMNTATQLCSAFKQNTSPNALDEHGDNSDLNVSKAWADSIGPSETETAPDDRDTRPPSPSQNTLGPHESIQSMVLRFLEVVISKIFDFSSSKFFTVDISG